MPHRPSYYAHRTPQRVRDSSQVSVSREASPPLYMVLFGVARVGMKLLTEVDVTRHNQTELSPQSTRGVNLDAGRGVASCPRPTPFPFRAVRRLDVYECTTTETEELVEQAYRLARCYGNTGHTTR